ncbi:hypothetical protein [Mycolicibacterium chlorophenolicum]|uniref:Ferredoxin n=1 Tax=Mycolicibacterium chlorophenolicum TaxID=37916 RepID=A0A0J6ZDF4_9MYCO|nr:hypothetical protein [Mycolicibacterium chlorophenolicum]KMO82776.1 hypothetical protein MCHLDSM_00656 [Mycolicibacterium chlorophenolicum]
MTVRPDVRLADAPMTPVVCQQCGACVEARKSSWNQTSVQWTSAAMSRCVERRTAAQVDNPHGTPVFLACSALAEAIRRDAVSGTLAIVDDCVHVNGV